MAETDKGRRSRNPDQTTRRLREATKAQLVASGFAALSVQRILKDAGVSKGALFHHFPSKDHLVAAAFEDVLTEMLERLEKAGRDLRTGRCDRRGFVEQLTALVEDDLYIGSMEISLGIRTELALGDLSAPAIQAWRESLFAFWLKTFDLPGKTEAEVREHWAIASNSLRGHAFSFSFGNTDDARQRHFTGFERFFLADALTRAPDPADLTDDKIININSGRI